MLKGIIINQDADGILKGIGLDPERCTVDDIIHFVHELEGTHITDYVTCVFSTVTVYPSKVCTSLIDRYHRNPDTDSYTLKGAHQVFDILGVDHVAIMNEEFKKIGINHWISFRMNDMHDRNNSDSHLFSDFYRDHPEVRRVKNCPELMESNSDKIYDYGCKEVRDHMLFVIDEALGRYDCYGIELDFQRELYVFAYGEEYDGIEIMNAFMRDVFAIVKKHEKQYGHGLKIAVRVAASPELSLCYGLDVMQWVQEGLIDMVTPAPRHGSVDNDIPVKLWHTLLSPYKVVLAPGLEKDIHPILAPPVRHPTLATFAAAANNFYSQGADKIYFHNYFRSRLYEHFDKSLGIITDEPDINVQDRPGYLTAISTIGDDETVKNLDKRYILTPKDHLPPWMIARTPAKENRAASQLPFTFAGRGRFKFSIGEIKEGSELTLRLCCDYTDKAFTEPPKVFVGDCRAEYKGREKDERFNPGGELLVYKLPPEAARFTLGVSVLAETEVTVTYMDVYVKSK